MCSPLLRFNCAQSLTYILFHYDAIVSLQQLPLTNEGIHDSLLTPRPAPSQSPPSPRRSRPTGVPTLRAHRGGDRNRGGSGLTFRVRGYYHVTKGGFLPRAERDVAATSAGSRPGHIPEVLHNPVFVPRQV